MEKNIELKFKGAVIKAGGKCYKFVSPGTTGVPDRVIHWPGGTVHYAEIKDGANKDLSPRQEIMKKEFEKLGIRVEVIKTEQDIINYINSL